MECASGTFELESHQGTINTQNPVEPLLYAGRSDRTADGRSWLRPEWDILRHAAGLLFDEMEDCLLEGSAIHTPLGSLTPSVTGVWGASNRLLPEVRQQNKAAVRYAMSPRLKKALSNPLFHEVSTLASRLDIFSVRDFYSQTENDRITPGQSISVKGNLLLMNGTSPRRGLYFVSAESGEEICHLQPESFAICTRSNIVALVPKDLPEGEYRLRVVSQCTTSPRPLKTPATYTMPSTLIVGDLQNQEESSTFATSSK